CTISKYNTYSEVHLLIAFNGLTDYFLKSILRPGKLILLNENLPETTLFLSEWNSFLVPAIYEFCENELVYYIIRFNSNECCKNYIHLVKYLLFTKPKPY